MQHGGGLGFVDSKLKGSSYIANQPNVVTYRNDRTCRTGSITKEKVGEGFQFQDKVTVTANLTTGEVAWSIGNKVLHLAQYDLIKDKDIEWVPYIRLCDKGDQIEIIFNHEENKDWQLLDFSENKQMKTGQRQVVEKDIEKMSFEEVEALINSYDYGDNEQISQEEFYALMTRKV